MTTTSTLQPWQTVRRPSRSRPGAVAIPLAEFGKSINDADLYHWFEAFGERNSDEGQYEISNEGFLLIMPPTGHPGSLHEGEFYIDLGIWTRGYGGLAFPSTSRFILPDGSCYGPDAAWVSAERRHELRAAPNIPFPHLVPDFIVEVQSPSNSDTELIDKITLFISYGTKLAWLINSNARTVTRFRTDHEPEVLYDPEFVDGDEDVLPGFRFAVRARIFDNENNPQ